MYNPVSRPIKINTLQESTRAGAEEDSLVDHMITRKKQEEDKHLINDCTGREEGLKSNLMYCMLWLDKNYILKGPENTPTYEKVLERSSEISQFCNIKKLLQLLGPAACWRMPGAGPHVAPIVPA